MLLLPLFLSFFCVTKYILENISTHIVSVYYVYVYCSFIVIYFKVQILRGNTRIRNLALGARRRAANGTPKTAITKFRDSRTKRLLGKVGNIPAKEARRM